MLSRTSLLAIGLALTFSLGWALLPSNSSAILAASCDPARAHDAGEFEETIESGGETREYLLYVPESYTGDEPVPLVLNLHGLAANRRQQTDYTSMPAMADREGFVLVAPQGLVTDFIGLPHWNNTKLEPRPDDVAFIRDLIDTLSAELCIDQTRVFSMGLSMGGMMSSRLACDLSDRIAAIAPVAGLYFPPLGEGLPESPECNSTRPVPIRAFHGTADPVVPFDGGALDLSILPGADLTFRDQDDDILPTWAAHQGCEDTPSVEVISENVHLISYDECDEGSVVELYVIDGGGHTWPGAATDLVPDIVGPTTREISANELAWEFFQEHPLAQAPQQETPASTAPPALPDTGAADDHGGVATVWLLAIGMGAGALVVIGGFAFLRKRHVV